MNYFQSLVYTSFPFSALLPSSSVKDLRRFPMGVMADLAEKKPLGNNP